MNNNKFKLRDHRSLDTLYDQANSWEAIHSLCVCPGVKGKYGTYGTSGREMVEEYIKELHYQASKYKWLLQHVNSETRKIQK